MKKLVLSTLAALAFSFNSYAGLLISSAQSEYTVGETLSVDLFYQTNDGSAAADVIDIWFDTNVWFTYSNDIASFTDFALSSAYDDADPFAFVFDYAANEAEYFLSTFGTAGPFDTSDLFSLGSLNFQTNQAGLFNFDVIDFALSDFNGYFDDTAQSSYSVNVVAAEVPEPATWGLCALTAFLLFTRKFSSTNAQMPKTQL
ncbi:hypothetical protein [Catenovulum sediminis]|uniref:hypothetical protein n=1 Tax=Catenovulum sediminis TaxID=1740262 RepID=UPI00117DAD79|nr:hypothetical protein [Catenovulum sediminis]